MKSTNEPSEAEAEAAGVSAGTGSEAEAAGASAGLCLRECVLFIGTQCSNLYTSVDTPAKGRVGGGGLFVITCKYVLGPPQVS